MDGNAVYTRLLHVSRCFPTFSPVQRSHCVIQEAGVDRALAEYVRHLAEALMEQRTYPGGHMDAPEVVLPVHA